MSPPSEPDHVEGEDDLLDATDTDVLDQFGELLELLDPPPADLDLRVRFALDLEQLDAEVAALTRPLADAGARGAERVRIELRKDGLELMVTVTPYGSTRRLDGWLAPGAPLRVEVRLMGSSLVAVADDDGRFVFEDVPPGLVQFVVHRPDRRPIVTTVIEL